MDSTHAADDLKAMFESADINKTGQLDYHEFLQWQLPKLEYANCGRTTCKSRTATPEWNETFELDVKPDTYKINVAVFDSHLRSNVHLHTFTIDPRVLRPDRKLHLNSMEQNDPC